MENSEYYFLELLVTESGGAFGRAGSPHFFCRLRAKQFPGAGFHDGNIVVVNRDDRTGIWREYAQAVSPEQSREILERLKLLGMPEHLPEVQGAFDTSDGWSHIFFQVTVNDQHSFLNIGMQVSGFAGPDAEPLRNLFRYLFSLAKFDQYNVMTYGQG